METVQIIDTINSTSIGCQYTLQHCSYAELGTLIFEQPFLHVRSVIFKNVTFYELTLHGFLFDTFRYRGISQWTRVNFNSNRTDPCAGLCAVPARPYTMQVWFQL